jgi:hypothetical protein
VAQFTAATSPLPPNAVRAISVLTDLIGNAEALGETALKTDPNFQGALARITREPG